MESNLMTLLTFSIYGIMISMTYTKYFLITIPNERNEIHMNLSDLARNSYMLRGSFARRGYMRWWHSFVGVNVETGKPRTFFVEFFMINPNLGSNHPILGQHPYYKKRGMSPSYVMVKAGAFPDENDENGKQLHAFYPISSLQITGNPLVMRMNIPSPETAPLSMDHTQENTCFYSEDRLTGSIVISPQKARHRSLMTDFGSMEWELEVCKAVSCHTGLLGGRLFQMLHILDNYWHGEGIRSFFRGSVILDGDVYEVTPEHSYGYADKHWGRNFHNPWFQFSCGNLTSQRTGKELRHSVLAINSFYPRLLCFPLRRRFMLQMTYMGEDFEFTNCKWEVKETDRRFIWHILARNKNSVLKLSGSCKKEDMLHLRYEAPDGQLCRLPLWAGADGIGTLQLYRKETGGRELLDTLKLENAMCIYRKEETTENA